MLRQSIQSSVLVALVSVPGFLVGQKLRTNDPALLSMLAVLAVVVLLASAIMRLGDKDEPRASSSIAPGQD